jgi:hypothetical protein
LKLTDVQMSYEEALRALDTLISGSRQHPRDGKRWEHAFDGMDTFLKVCDFTPFWSNVEILTLLFQPSFSRCTGLNTRVEVGIHY